MPKRSHVHNAPAKETELSGAPRAIVLREFGNRLYELLREKGWNQSELAREAAKHMPNKKFSRDNVSKYIRGRFLPNAKHLDALSKALGVDRSDLLPEGSSPSASESSPPLDVRDAGNGEHAWLHVNQRVPWPVALKVLSILKGEE